MTSKIVNDTLTLGAGSSTLQFTTPESFQLGGETLSLSEAGELSKLLVERSSDWQDTYKVIGPLAKEVLGIEMSQQQFCAFMILLKLVRFYKSDFTSKDCIDDIIGYANLTFK